MAAPVDRSDRYWRVRLALAFLGAVEAGDASAVADIRASAAGDPDAEAVIRDATAVLELDREDSDRGD
jgi:hypothetical protein